MNRVDSGGRGPRIDESDEAERANGSDWDVAVWVAGVEPARAGEPQGEPGTGASPSGSDPATRGRYPQSNHAAGRPWPWTQAPPGPGNRATVAASSFESGGCFWTVPHERIDAGPLAGRDRPSSVRGPEFGSCRPFAGS